MADDDAPPSGARRRGAPLDREARPDARLPARARAARGRLGVARVVRPRAGGLTREASPWRVAGMHAPHLYRSLLAVMLAALAAAPGVLAQSEAPSGATSLADELARHR